MKSKYYIQLELFYDGLIELLFKASGERPYNNVRFYLEYLLNYDIWYKKSTEILIYLLYLIIFSSDNTVHLKLSLTRVGQITI